MARSFDSPDVLIAVATLRELPALGFSPPSGAGGVAHARVHGLAVAGLVCGVGPVNAAFSLGGALARLTPRLILSAGIGGAFPGRGLPVGGVAVATSERDADIGVEGSSPERPREPLSLSVNEGEFATFPADPKAAESLFSSVPEGLAKAKGVFVTSATVTASTGRAAQLGAAYSALCENMEGAALARGAQRAGIPFAEARGISNLVGPRELSSWRLDEAIRAVSRTVEIFLNEMSKGAR